MADSLRLDALIRVSQVSGRTGEEFRSPDQQREIIQREADRLNAGVFWHPPALDVSGKTMDRADLAAILQRLRDGQTDGLIVAFANRLSRARVDEALSFKAAINEAGGRLVVCDMGGIDLDSAGGELMFTQLVAFARYQWRQSAERWDMSQRDAINAGKSIAKAPFGYRYTDPTKRPGGRGVVNSRLIPDETEAPILRELFEMRAKGATWLEMARWLDTAAPKPNGRAWARSTVKSMIGHRSYLGEVFYGKHHRIGAHEPLVPLALWQRAQREPGRRTPRGHYLLTGLVRCARCGRKMRASSGGTKKPAVFVCQTAECPVRYSTVVIARLDEEVVAQLFARLAAAHVEEVDDGEIVATELEVRERTGDVERLAQIVPMHAAAVVAHQASLQDAERVLVETEERLRHLVASRDATTPGRSLIDDWSTIPANDQRELVRGLVDAVLVRRALRRKGRPIAERIRVLFHGEAPADLLNGRGALRDWSWHDDP